MDLDNNPSGTENIPSTSNFAGNFESANQPIVGFKSPEQPIYFSYKELSVEENIARLNSKNQDSSAFSGRGRHAVGGNLLKQKSSESILPKKKKSDGQNKIMFKERKNFLSGIAHLPQTSYTPVSSLFDGFSTFTATALPFWHAHEQRSYAIPQHTFNNNITRLRKTRIYEEGEPLASVGVLMQ